MPKRPNNDGSIGRYKDGWRAQYTDPITHKQKSLYAKTQRDVTRKLQAKLDEIRRGAYVPADRLLTGAWLDEWFNTFYRPTVKPSTAATSHGNICRLKESFGTIPLQQLTAVHIQRFIRQLQEEGCSPTTIKRYMKVLSQALEQAIALRKLQENPVKAVRMPPMQRTEIRTLTTDEQHTLLEHLPDTTPAHALQFLLGTGMRVSELCGLCWKDLREDVLHVDRTYMIVKDLDNGGSYGCYGTPKTATGKRVIPLTDTLRGILSAQKEQQQQDCTKCGTAWQGPEPGSADCPIFASMVGTPLDRHNLARSFRKLLKDAGLPTRGVHTLRHTFATNWVRKSPDVVSLSRVIGHSDPAFTYKTYCHTDATAMNEGMEMMEQFLQA